MKKILLLEDDASVRGDIQEVLASRGYRVLATDLVSTAWHLFTNEKPDLAVLDLGLPDGSGLDLCKKIRDHADLGFTPVIILTAQSEFDTKVEGFKAGADQYLTKPVSPKEFLLWVEALLRRLDFGKDDGNVIRAGELSIDTKSHIVRFKAQTIAYLTCKEFELLTFLVQKRPQVLSRKQILTNLWHTIAVDRLVDVHLGNLRRKLPQELADKLQAVPGKGYRFLE